MIGQSEFLEAAKKYVTSKMSFQEFLDDICRNGCLYLLFNLDKRRKGYEIYKIYADSDENLQRIFDVLHDPKHGYGRQLYELNYFCYAYELIEKFIDRDICSVRDIVDIFQKYGYLHFLTENSSLWKNLEKSNKLTNEDLEYLLKSVNEHRTLYDLLRNDSLFSSMMSKNILNKTNFAAFIEKLDRFSLLSEILTSNAFRKHLNLLTDDDTNLRLYINKLFFPSTTYKTDSDLEKLLLLRTQNSKPIYECAVKKGFVSDVEFLKFLERSKNSSVISTILRNETNFLRILVQHNKLDVSSLKNYFESIQSMSTLIKLFESDSQVLKKYFIESNLYFDKTMIENLNLVVEEGIYHYRPSQSRYHSDRYRSAKDFFDFVQIARVVLGESKTRLSKDDLVLFERLLRNKEMYELDILSFTQFNNEQLYLVYDCVKSSETARVVLSQIVDCNLQSQYSDFDSFIEMLSKDESKKKIKLNL